VTVAVAVVAVAVAVAVVVVVAAVVAAVVAEVTAAEWEMAAEGEWATVVAADPVQLRRHASPRATPNIQARKAIRPPTKPVSAHRAERNARNEIRNERSGDRCNKCNKFVGCSKRLARAKCVVSSLFHENSVDDCTRDRARSNGLSELGRWLQQQQRRR
jgi:hypothetical protein